ncbi:MAG TPA: HNH endonuclease [Candidatus Anammoximicrobium sp.]|nr:HNH endonuclease [Candidatus Anammoximicrobium sp.]
MSVYVPVELQRAVRTRFGNCCAYCHTAEDLTIVVFEFEHISPRASGGETVFDNLCLACPTCNRCKADRTAAVDPATGREVPLFHPQQDEWTDHFAWSEDGTRIVALTPTGRATVAALRMNRPQLIRMRRMWVAMSEHPPDLE